MIEHRLIERMLAAIQDALGQIKKTGKVDPIFVDTAVDFILTYADLTHHGKEEDILFRDLNKKDLSDVDRKVMNELLEEHILGRSTTRALVEANTRYRMGDSSALEDLVSCLHMLLDFYPGHIEKEDRVFFPACRAYFSEAEEQAMLDEFRDFDQKMIHRKYKSLVDDLGK